MEPARPLRDVFTDLVGTDRSADPTEALRAGGHDLPDALVSEAVTSYADTAPVEVAEHLSPYVMANGPVPQPDGVDVDPGSWLNLVATAPAVDTDPLVDLDDLAPASPAQSVVHDVGAGPDLSFGHGVTSPHPAATVDDTPELDGADDHFPTDAFPTDAAQTDAAQADPSWLDGPVDIDTADDLDDGDDFLDG